MGITAVVGAGAGIGRFLAKKLGAIPFVRGDDPNMLIGVDTIIYCAAKARFETPQDDIAAALEDNLFLLDRISRVPHKRFVYFSSVDVYPVDAGVHREDEKLVLEQVRSGYPAFKLMAEAVVLKRCVAPLILRPTSLFGPGMRPNNIVRLFNRDPAGLSLRADATFNCITYDMVAALIEAAYRKGVSGIVNCAAADSVCLRDLAHEIGYEGDFGIHVYQAPRLSNQKARALVSGFERSSFEILKDFFASLQHQP